MDKPVVLPGQAQYVEDLYEVIVDVAPDRFRMWSEHGNGANDDLLLGDVELATAQLVRAGLDRHRALGLSHTLRCLDARPSDRHHDANDEMEFPTFEFVKEVRATYGGMAGRLRTPDPRQLAPDPFEIVVNLTDPFLRQSTIELVLAGLDFTARWLQGWGYVFDERAAAMTVVSFTTVGTIAERRRALQALCRPDGDQTRLTTPASNVTVPNEIRSSNPPDTHQHKPDDGQPGLERAAGPEL